jgi:hypothetical protein
LVDTPSLEARVYRSLIVIAAVSSGSLRLVAQGAPEPPKRIAASSFATVEVHLNSRPIEKRWYEEDAALTGPSRIAITYSQSTVRPRSGAPTATRNETSDA